MSDLDQLDPRIDAAFEALTRDLAHSRGPGASAAVATARTRRRTRVGAVALAALVVVGGGVVAPRLLVAEDGVAADGGSARFDTATLGRATEGWIGEWETWERYSPWGGGGFSTAGCSSAGGGPGGGSGPEPVSRGVSRFVSHSDSTAVLVLSHYAGVDRARSADELALPAPDTCGTTTTYDIDGVRVRHDSIPQEGGTPVMWLGDLWSVRIGADRAYLEITNDSGVADTRTAEEVAEALVAGLRDGWTQLAMEDVEPAAAQAEPLPALPDADLADALAGWQSASRGRGSGINTPCLGTAVQDGALVSSTSGTARGVSHELAGYDDRATGTERVAAMVDELRACEAVPMDVRELANGVYLATYAYGDGHGALWLAADGDRAGVVGVDGAGRALPTGVDDAVADVLHRWLRIPWN